MPIHDYRCEPCGVSLLDHYLPLQSSAPPLCVVCGTPCTRLWSTSGMSKPFQAFEFELDNGKTVSIDSLAKLRKVENDSMKSYEKGEGRPFLFRNYSQDSTNKDASLFGHLKRQQINPYKARTVAGKPFDFAAIPEGRPDPEFHPATLKAMQNLPSYLPQRSRSRSR